MFHERVLRIETQGESYMVGLAPESSITQIFQNSCSVDRTERHLVLSNTPVFQMKTVRSSKVKRLAQLVFRKHKLVSQVFFPSTNLRLEK